jgi:hypothetical protein
MRNEIAAVPALPARFERDRAAEGSAIEVALRFLDDIDRRDFDDAWDLSSAVLKATMSRPSFEARLRALPSAGRAERQEAFHTFAPGAFIPGSELDILFARPEALEAILLRMDDVMEWRVAALATMAREVPAPSDMTAGAI